MKNLQNMAFCWLLLAALSSVQTPSQGEEQLASPRLSTLQKELDAGYVAAMESFWREIGKHGTPLIEPLAGDDAHRLATFLWRAKEETRNESVASVVELSGAPPQPWIMKRANIPAGRVEWKRLIGVN
jgi:hypothetical protein